MPSIGLVISGDCVYDNTHVYLAECDEKARREWLGALDKIEALRPRAVVAGHGVLDPDSSPHHIDETKRYILDFNATLASASSAEDLYEKMLTLHPNRVIQARCGQLQRSPNCRRLWVRVCDAELTSMALRHD